MSNFRPRAITALLVACALVPGCIPLAWVTPPAQLEVGAAPELHLDEQGHYRRHEYSLPIRAGLYPLQAFPSLLDRPIDVGVGYQFAPTTQRGLLQLHGPYVDLAYLSSDDLPPMDLLLDGSSVDRMTFRGRGYTYFSPGSDGLAGMSGSVQVVWEWFSHTDGDLGGCQSSNQGGVAVLCGAGYAYGETAVGVYVEGSYGEIADKERYWAGAGVIVRLPSSYGLGFLLILSDSWF